MQVFVGDDSTSGATCEGVPNGHGVAGGDSDSDSDRLATGKPARNKVDDDRVPIKYAQWRGITLRTGFVDEQEKSRGPRDAEM